MVNGFSGLLGHALVALDMMTICLLWYLFTCFYVSLFGLKYLDSSWTQTSVPPMMADALMFFEADRR
jgi:hypothetical protein